MPSLAGLGFGIFDVGFGFHSHAQTPAEPDDSGSSPAKRPLVNDLLPTVPNRQIFAGSFLPQDTGKLLPLRSGQMLDIIEIVTLFALARFLQRYWRSGPLGEVEWLRGLEDGDMRHGKCAAHFALAADRVAAADGCRGQQHGQHQHHRLQVREHAVPGLHDAQGPDNEFAGPTSRPPLHRGLVDHPRHDHRPDRADRQPARCGAERQRLPHGADAGRHRATPATARCRSTPSGHARRPRRQPGAWRVAARSSSTAPTPTSRSARTARINTSQGSKGKLAVVEFADPQALAREGNNYYSGPAGQPATQTKIVQGSIERSNVSGVTEMADMIRVRARLPDPRQHHAKPGRSAEHRDPKARRHDRLTGRTI